MKKIRYHVACSLDGYIATPEGGYDWLVDDPDIDFNAIFAEYDTLLIGRKTYDLMLRQQEQDPSLEGIYKNHKLVVFSRTLRPQDHPDVLIVSDHLENAIADLRAVAKKDLWLFGGGELFRTFLELGCVDTVELAVMPILLGSGLAFLPTTSAHHRLAFRSQHVYSKSGIVMLKYDVV